MVTPSRGSNLAFSQLEGAKTPEGNKDAPQTTRASWSDARGQRERLPPVL